MFAESSHLRSRQRTSKPAKCIQFSYIPFALPRFNAPRFFERPTSFLSFHRCRRPSSPSKGCRRLSVSEFSHSQHSRMGESPRVASQEFCKFLPGNLNINWKPTGQSVSSYRFKFHGTVFRGGAKLGKVFAAGATRSWHRSTRRGLAMQGF